MTPDQIGLVRAMKGAPASIVLALVLCGHALTNKDLEQMTGYSDKPISKGLALLELHGLVQYNGYAHGWSLTAAGARQLSMFDNLLPGESRNISEVGEFPTLSSSSSYISTEKKEEEERNAREVGEFPTLNGQLVDKSEVALRQLLVDAGVGRRSRKLRELLDAGLEIGYVQAHIQARETAVARGEHYPVGWLITKLLDGDPVPSQAGKPDPLRQRIPDDLKDIVKR